MIKKLICIDCPVGCLLSVNVKDFKVIKVKGGKCVKGEEYAQNEIENPTRILTSTVKTQNLSVPYLPIRTDHAIPKALILDAMSQIKQICIKRPVNSGDIVCNNFLGLKVNIIATRTIIR